VADLGEFLRDLGADLLGQALGGPELGKGVLQGLVALAKRIVFRIRDGGRVLLVIAPVMLGDLGPQGLVLDAGLFGFR
jgi:hypothetical protein